MSPSTPKPSSWPFLPPCLFCSFLSVCLALRLHQPLRSPCPGKGESDRVTQSRTAKKSCGVSWRDVVEGLGIVGTYGEPSPVWGPGELLGC